MDSLWRLCQGAAFKWVPLLGLLQCELLHEGPQGSEVGPTSHVIGVIVAGALHRVEMLGLPGSVKELPPGLDGNRVILVPVQHEKRRLHLRYSGLRIVAVDQ